MFIHSDQRENLSSGCSWENESEANLLYYC